MAIKILAIAVLAASLTACVNAAARFTDNAGTTVNATPSHSA